MLIYAFLLLLLLYLLLILPTQWLKIERVRHPLGLNLKIMQISDLHVEKLRIFPNRLQSIVEEEEPDLIFLTGDFTRNERYLPKVDRYLKCICKREVPVYAVLGNHDYRIRKVSRLLQVFQKHRVQVLRNETVACGNFQLVGIDDFSSGKSNAVRAFQNVELNRPVVIITHDPNVVPHIRS